MGSEEESDEAQLIIQMAQAVSIQPMPKFNPDMEVGSTVVSEYAGKIGLTIFTCPL